MFASTRRWFRRNRTNLVIGAGVIGAGYLAGQYVLGKIHEARQRMSDERIAKENLRRRFEQNQEDCTYTVLALLPAIREEVIGSLPVEQITEQLQQDRQNRLKRLGASEAASSEFPSAPPSIADDASLQSSSFIHASQMAGSSTDSGISSQSPKRSKAQLWQDMKINSITRTLTLLYTLPLLALLTRIQLNLLGRRTYLSSVVALASPPAPTHASTISLENRDDDNYDNVYGNDFETNRKYLIFSWWLLHRGSKQVQERVSAAVKEVFGVVNIREEMALERLADLVMQVRRKIEGASETDRRKTEWLSVLLPPKEQELFVIRQSGVSDSDESPSPEAVLAEDPLATETISPSLRRLLNETSDLIESPTFSLVLTRLVDASFSHLVDYHIATEAFGVVNPASPGSEPRISEVEEKKCRLANILPVFSRQAHAIAVGSGELDALAGVPAQEGLGNEYLTVIDQVQDLEAFAAVIYSSNFDYEVAESSGEAQAPRPSRPAAPQHGADDLEQSVDVEEADVVPAARNTLMESEVVVPSDSLEAPSGAEGGFETAWRKALATEDGV